jgi:sugar phosphate isomerase/epimerase
VEFRAFPGEPVTVELGVAERSVIRHKLEDAGLSALTIASYVKVAATIDSAIVIESLLRHIELAADIGAPYVRVFPGATGGLSTPESDSIAVDRLASGSNYARDFGVTIALETHDSHPSAADAMRIIDRLDRGSSVGIIWDILHTSRAGESIANSWGILEPFLLHDRGYIQVKDVASFSDVTPVVPGEGILPLTELRSTLSGARYTGPICLEWERAWYPEIESLDRPLAAVRDWITGG